MSPYTKRHCSTPFSMIAAIIGMVELRTVDNSPLVQVLQGLSKKADGSLENWQANTQSQIGRKDFICWHAMIAVHTCHDLHKPSGDISLHKVLSLWQQWYRQRKTLPKSLGFKCEWLGTGFPQPVRALPKRLIVLSHVQSLIFTHTATLQPRGVSWTIISGWSLTTSGKLKGKTNQWSKVFLCCNTFGAPELGFHQVQPPRGSIRADHLWMSSGKQITKKDQYCQMLRIYIIKGHTLSIRITDQHRVWIGWSREIPRLSVCSRFQAQLLSFQSWLSPGLLNKHGLTKIWTNFSQAADANGWQNHYLSWTWSHLGSFPASRFRRLSRVTSELSATGRREPSIAA